MEIKYRQFKHYNNSSYILAYTEYFRIFAVGVEYYFKFNINNRTK
nr:MAG TPA: hypothetical protein [Caudoviricetes sp.]